MLQLEVLVCAVLEFCQHGEFQDTAARVCLPIGSAYVSGIDVANALDTYSNCDGVTSEACAAARGVLYEGMGCPFCAAIADRAAPSQAACAAVTTEAACVLRLEAGRDDAGTGERGPPNSTRPDAADSGTGSPRALRV